jgi:excisionase family DNA binding protein
MVRTDTIPLAVYAPPGFTQRRIAMPIESQELLSRAEAAAYLGVSKMTLEDWACSGRVNLPFIKIGGRAKYRKSDLDRWISARTATSAAGHRAAMMV